MILYKISNVNFLDPNNTHFVQNPNTTGTPMTNTGLLIGGTSLAGLSTFNRFRNRMGTENYGQIKKNYKSVSKSLANWKKNNTIDDTLKNYMTKNNISDVSEVKSHLKNYAHPVIKNTRWKWTGRLGLGAAAYGAYNLLNESTHSTV